MLIQVYEMHAELERGWSSAKTEDHWLRRDLREAPIGRRFILVQVGKLPVLIRPKDDEAPNFRALF